MRRILRWVSIVLGSIAGLMLLAVLVVYAVSERELRRTYEVPAVSVAVPTDPASIQEGERLAAIHGCFGGCHGRQAEGAVMFDEPMIARFVAPNLTAAARKFSDAELAVAIRNGLRPDGRSMVVMPSEAFIALTDEDLGRIIAFLKSLPETPGPGPHFELGPLGRVGFLAGKFKTAARLIAETVPPPEATSTEAARGRYLARSICAQCHGADLRGMATPAFVSPDLRVATAYPPNEFSTLLRKGIGLGGRDLPMMGPWVRGPMSQLTDAEIAALYSYLHAL